MKINIKNELNKYTKEILIQGIQDSICCGTKADEFLRRLEIIEYLRKKVVIKSTDTLKMPYYFKTPLGTMAELNETSSGAKMHLAEILGLDTEDIKEITLSEFKGEE